MNLFVSLIKSFGHALDNVKVALKKSDFRLIIHIYRERFVVSTAVKIRVLLFCDTV